MPLRSGVTHKYQFPTNKAQKCGVDYTKAIIIDDVKYIDFRRPHIREDEYKVLIGKEHILKTGMESYINKYIKALGKQHIKANKELCRFSTLQNYHEELGLIEVLKEIAVFKQNDDI